MGIKRDKIDAIFSKMIRERDCWTCQKCGRHYPDGGQGLHCSHLYSRRHARLRFDPLNAVAHCYSCHQYLGENPIEFDEWIKGYLGTELYEELRALKSMRYKSSKKIKEEIYKRLKEEWEWMQEQRNSGREGRLDFKSPYED